MELLLLATEAAAEGGSDTARIVMVVLVAGLVAFGLAFFIVGPGRGRKRGDKRTGDIPLAMRPYHSDEELESSAMERAMAWGVALSLFAGVFLAVYWMIEPARINAQRDAYYEEDVVAGRTLFTSNCSTCHGTNAEGGSAPNPYGEAPWPAPRLNNIEARYADSAIVTDVEDFIRQTLIRGRPGTPMAAWRSDYNGPMNDQQINDLVTYLLSIQIDEVEPIDAEAFAGASGGDIFANNCARCHGDNLEGRVGPNLTNIYERYGADLEDPATFGPVRETIEQTLINGRLVPGVGVMPSFKDTLPEDAIQAVIDHIESQQVPGGERFGQVGGPPAAATGETEAAPSEAATDAQDES
ncbi:c-type cytochrome [Salsipaludibacter albus]|uniref:c-type cytochrome n=1 Tax=Salsipaludibacter albus TaxID=2849650 RepID=UPI001EE3D27C|nr:c-type cytochrome [Salsipaludibacter albus]MBY5161082.1 c-type cytochrome [Salsipaludibacter albus]